MTIVQTPSAGSSERAGYGFGTSLPGPFDDAVRRTTEALKAEGFGILTTIDVRKTFKEKLDVDFEPYVILGACNPGLARRALQAEHELGLLLPCNVIVHQDGEEVAVSIVDPDKMLSVAGDDPELAMVAAEASARLRRVVAALAGGSAQAAS